MPSQRHLAAILFSDIVGYTAMMQENEVHALQVIKRYQEVMKSGVQRFDGAIRNDYGDGSLSIFNSAIEALRCAHFVQTQFQHPPRVPLRIGLHSGEILVEEGKIYSDSVNVASRIESIGKAGSVLLSERIYEVIKNHPEFPVRSLGRFRFKNVRQPVQLYALACPPLYLPHRHELESPFSISNLPDYADVFVGRSHHLQALCDLLNGQARLVTLLGPGGIGKTRLSIRTGELLVDSFPEGVCYVPLDTVTDPQQVPRHIGQRLGLKQSLGQSWTTKIEEHLINQHLLLILDNLEQVLGATDIIGNILDKCPRVKILTTSREILGLPYEIEYPLDSLNRPNPRLFPGVEDLLKFDAIELFVRKAQMARPGFRLNEPNAAAVVRICQELEGLPLAIELAASRIKLFSPDLLLKQLRKRPEILKSKSKVRTQRHQTLQNAVKWSYDLLDSVEQEQFQQLALFRGGFTPQALEFVFPYDDSLDLIESFLNKSLIIKGEEVGDMPRFRMLKLIRDYGVDHLQNNPQRDRYYKGFAQYYHEFLQEAVAQLQGANQSWWSALIEAEYENLLVAIEWLAKHDMQAAGRFVAEFWRFHLNRGFLREGLELIGSILELNIGEKTVVARLLEGAGSLSHNLGNYLEAKNYFQRGLETWQQQGNQKEVARALNHLGWAEWRIGNFTAALQRSQEALAISHTLRAPSIEARSLNNMAWTHLRQGYYEKTVDLQRQILDIHTRSAAVRGIAFARLNLGWGLLRMGRLTEADEHIEAAIRAFAELKDQQLLSFSHLIKAEWLVERNRTAAAQQMLKDHCLVLFEQIGDLWGLAHSHDQMGRLCYSEGDLSASREHLEKALFMFQQSHDKFGEANSLLSLSRLYLELNSDNSSKAYLDRSMRLASDMQANELLMRGYAEHVLRSPISKKSEALLNAARACAQKVGPHAEKQLAAILSDGRSWPRTQDEKSPFPTDPFLLRVWKTITAHLEDPDFSVTQLCREVGMSQSQLHRRLQSLIGISIGKYIRQIRLEKAQTLLQDPERTVAAIAYDTGFRDPDYFYRVFKKEFGLTPGAYRQRSINSGRPPSTLDE